MIKIKTSLERYYVYVLIDPRNYEEFYYGKGTGDRKDEHEKEVKLDKPNDDFNSAKIERIRKIKKEGLSPIARVIAKNLTSEQALLVEKTLIWKLGKYTTNISSGHFSDKFRPHNTIYKELSTFDFINGLYYFNVGEYSSDDGVPQRCWEDCVKYNFISAGQGRVFQKSICALKKGDIIAAYISKKGYVGIGRVTQEAMQIHKVIVDKTPLLDLELKSKGLSLNKGDKNNSEYVALVEWIKAVDRKEAKRETGIFANPSVRASLDNQPKTVKYLEKEFSIKFDDLKISRISK